MDARDAFEQYPTEGGIYGWRFRVQETSANVYLALGRDRFGRLVSHRGTDPVTLLRECQDYARQVLRELTRFGDNQEFFACIELLCDDLAAAGSPDLADGIRLAMYSGCTGGEVLGATRHELKAAQRTRKVRDAALQRRVDVLINAINKAFADVGS